MTSAQDASVTYTISLRDDASEGLENLDKNLTNVERTTRKTTLATAAQRREFLRGGQSMFFAAGSAARLGERLGVLNKKQAETISTIADIGTTIFSAAIAFDKFGKNIKNIIPFLLKLKVPLAIGALTAITAGVIAHESFKKEKANPTAPEGFPIPAPFLIPPPSKNTAAAGGGTTVNINAGVITGNPADAAKFGRIVTAEDVRNRRNRGLPFDFQ